MVNIQFIFINIYMQFDLLVEKILKSLISSEVETLLERRFQPTTLMYHGTSSVFLRSILKNGLDPNPKQKSWDVGGAMPSLGGVYMAPNNARSTRNAAKEAVEKACLLGDVYVTASENVVHEGLKER